MGFLIVAGRDGRGERVAEVRWPSKNMAANARLISAAPELLEALERLLAPTGSEPYPPPGSAEAIDAARRAVRKARGANGSPPTGE
ncbi:MAG TPA: hypothetical protein VNO79_15435 [Actinomycetota bacterium]|nr:hypothetical protein [Actinomycetota bacterium]